LNKIFDKKKTRETKRQATFAPRADPRELLFDFYHLHETHAPHRKMNDLQRLDVLERREQPLTPSDVKVNAWVRVKGNLEYVKQLCADGFGGEGGGGGENQASIGGAFQQQEQEQYPQSNGGRPEPDYAVGWEDGMEDTIGKCFEVAVVSRAYRTTPVVGLCVGTGLVAIGGSGSSSRHSEASRESLASVARAKARKQAATMNKYGWYFPLEALEHI
jgi:hypothetical protein